MRQAWPVYRERGARNGLRRTACFDETPDNRLWPMGLRLHRPQSENAARRGAAIGADAATAPACLATKKQKAIFDGA